MESLVYENSPLAEYLRGKVSKLLRHGICKFTLQNHSGEGEDNHDWVIPETDVGEDNASDLTQNFAPRGTSRFQERVRNKLPDPLDLNSPGRKTAFSRFYDACSSLLNSRIGRNDNERFLEQFGYVIVASQLLNEHSAPSYTSAADVMSTWRPAEIPSHSANFGLQGAIVTGTTSFSIAWLLHWGRSRTGSGFNPRKVGVLIILVPLLGMAFFAFARRQWLKYLRHQAVQAAATLVSNAQGFDSAASASVVFIQEVELVSRGYRISTPLPPISRLEDQTHLRQTRRCLRLRRTVSECLFSMLGRYVQAQRTLQPLTDSGHLEKYYDIYDISVEELIEAEAGLSEPEEDQYSLRSLRNLFGRLHSVRKSVLCCLLALSADGGGSDIARWSTAIEEMRNLATVTGASMRRMTNILNEQDNGTVAAPASSSPAPSPSKDNLRYQYGKLNSLSQGIRALHAKMHIIREESYTNLNQTENASDLQATLLAQYESIGTDLRNLVQEWEDGKSSLMNTLDKQSVADRTPRSSTNLTSPPSPAFSLSGATAVEGGPADALKALNGDRPSPSKSYFVDDEEIFEADITPRRKRASLTREERIARVKEERAKKMAARDRIDANTSMMKELEMVIKQRPRGKTSKRVTSI